MNPIRQIPPEDWEAQLDRALKGLPNRRAPASLMPRVLATIEARARRPWYRQAWSTWPHAAQGLSLAVLSLLLGALTYACLHFPELGAPDAFRARLDTWLAPLAAVWTVVAALGDVAQAVCTKTGGWICIGLGTICVAAYLSAIGAGTALYRLACGRHGGGR